MSASYQTSAKPRGRREGDSMDQQSSSRNSSQTSSRLSRTTSRALEDVPISRNSRPDSPALFWQRNKALDPSRAQDSVVMSPRPSAASTRTGRTTPTLASADDKTPAPSSPTKAPKVVSSRKSLESARGSGASIGLGVDKFDGRQSSNTVTHRSGRLSRPSSEGSELLRAATARMQPKVSDVSEEDNSSQASPPVDVPSSRTSPEMSSARVSEVGEKQPSTALGAPPPREPPIQSPKYHAPNTVSPAISPPQSPQMYQQPMYGGQPAPYPYGYPPNPNMPGGFYAGAFSPTGRELPHLPSMVNKEEHQQILEKVTNVLPDINRLLAHYQETRGQLSPNDMMVKQTEMMRAEEIARLRLELDAKKEEYDKLIERLVGENYMYKLEVEEKNARIAALEEAVQEAKSLNKVFETRKVRHDEAVSTADTARLAKKDLLAEKLQLENTNASNQEQHKLDMEDLKREHMSQLEAKETDHNKTVSEHKTVLSKVQLELANLITKHSTVKKEFEASRGAVIVLERRLETTAKDHEAVRAAHEVDLDAKAKEAAELQIQHRQQMESQLGSLTTSRQQEVRALQELHDQKLKDVISDHESNTAKLAEEHTTQLTAVREELDGQKIAFGKLQTEHEQTAAKHNMLAGAMISWKKRHEEWQTENDKLHKLMESLGHSTDGKPDGTYVTAFELLAQSIEAISRDYFSQPPQGSPAQLGMLLEPNLPEILGSTETAVELRATMIQHKIFKVLHQRIFQRFVFVPFEDHADIEFDRVLGSLSRLISQKSLRREALWRSITLRTIYTNPEASNMVRTTAATVMEEILQQILDLSTPGDREVLVASIRKVVRSAIELWRQTQVEVDQISSTMPDLSNQDGLSNVILWVRPHIVRERIYQASTANGRQKYTSFGESRVLLHGTALRQDSPLILKRYEELARRVSLYE